MSDQNQQGQAAPQPGQPIQQSPIQLMGPDGKPATMPPPLPTPVWPSTEMPANPNAPGKDIQGNRPDCEGQIHAMPDPTTSPVPPPPAGKARIMIAIPMLMITYEFFESFLKFWTQLNLHASKDYEVGYHIAYRKPVHMAEEYLVETAIYNKCTHILFMDDDIYDITKEDVDKLFYANKDVIGGVMHASKFPHAMCVFRRYKEERKVIDMPVDVVPLRLYEVPCLCPKCGIGQSHWDAKFCVACGTPLDNLVQQADLIPFAFTLMKLSIFDKIKKPWFHCTSKYPTDSWFADRLIEAGMTEYGHMGVRLNHAGITDATKPHYMNMGMQKVQAQKAVVQLTPEMMEFHQRYLYDEMHKTEQRLRAKPQFHGDNGDKIINAEFVDESKTLVTHGR